MDKRIKEILITQDEIVDKCKELGKEITEYYKDYEVKPLFVTLMKGGIPFLAELMKHVEFDLEMHYMDVSSYQGTESVGDIKIIKDLDISIVDKDILLIEDIIDTGITLSKVIGLLLNKGAKSVKCASLLDKPSRRIDQVSADFVGFVIPDEFVIGFGLDYNQKFRNLPYVAILKEEYYAQEGASE